MAQIGTSILVITALAIGTAPSGAEAYTSFLNGQQYLDLSPDERTNYVMGLSDMMQRMSEAAMSAPEKAFMARFANCTSGMNGTRLREFVDTYMAENSSYGQYAMASNFRAAINTKCPK